MTREEAIAELVMLGRDAWQGAKYARQQVHMGRSKNLDSWRERAEELARREEALGMAVAALEGSNADR